MTVALSESANQNSVLFPKDARPYGASLVTWAERESQWAYGQPLERNPLIDQTGADCDVGQEGPVWFIPRIAGPPVFNGARSCTIPLGKAIFLEIGAYVNPYPCPDPNFRPAPGQSLYDFLRADAKAFMDGVNRLEVSLDGRPLNDVLGYRFASDDLFTLTGHPSFAALDPCVTGSPQPAVVDGFFMMFKPLERGAHVIRVYGTDVRGADKTYTYYLNVGAPPAGAPAATGLIALGPEVTKRFTGLDGALLRFRLVDAPSDGPWTVRIDWGDGEVNTPRVTRAGDLSFLRTKAFAAPGSSPVVVTVTDRNRVSGATATVPLTVP